MYNYLFLTLLSSLGWGLTPIIDRQGLKYVDKYNYLSIRLITIGICGLFYIICFGNNSNKIVSTKFHPIFYAILSGIVWCISILFYYLALSDLRIPLVNITILSYTLPFILVTILSYLFFDEPINYKKAFGLGITIYGIYVTITNNS